MEACCADWAQYFLLSLHMLIKASPKDNDVVNIYEMLPTAVLVGPSPWSSEMWKLSFKVTILTNECCFGNIFFFNGDLEISAG